MKLKYYLRGLGIGIIITAIILTIANAGKKESLTDAEIIQRAEQLGIVMPEEEESEEDSPEIKNKEEDEASNEAGQEVIENDDTVFEPQDTESQDEEPQDVGTQEENPVDTEEQDTETQEENPVDTEAQSPQLPVTGADAEYVTIEVVPGEHSYAICEKLVKAGLVDDAVKFNEYLVESDIDNRIATGSYSIPQGATYEELANILSGNK